MKNIAKKIKKEKIFLIVAFILIIIRVLLTTNLPIYAIGGSVCDDQLMIKLQSELLKFNWLGDFNSVTLVKGMFFPLYLAINLFLGIKYIDSITLFYVLSSLLFVWIIKDMFKSKWVKYVIFILLLFNPIMFAQNITRVYRNSISPAQVLLIFSGMVYIYYNRNNKKNLWLSSILTGIALGTFYNTREDSIWILPMVLVFTLIMIIEHIIKNKKKFKIKRIINFLLPFIILFFTNTSVSTINYLKYGVYSRIDEADGSFAKAIKAIYSVPNEKEIDYVSVSHKKLEKLYEISPSLNSIKVQLDDSINALKVSDRNPDDNEIEDGWFWWALRFGAEGAGKYKTAKEADEFYKNIAKEIIEAQNSKIIGKQNTMPSALMSPWRKNYFSKLVSATFDAIIYTNSYNETEPKLIDSIGDVDSIKLFEVATNSKALYSSNYDTRNAYSKHERKVLNIYINKLNIINIIYKLTGVLCFILGLISYFIITFIALFKNHKLIDMWLIISSILASYLVLCIGVSYSEISSFKSITYMYLSGAYPLIILFWAMSMFTLFDYKRNN